MGNWRTGDPEESGSFLDDFVEWMDTPEGQQSIEAHDLVFDALENAGVDPRQRKIVWDDGQRLSIERSVARIHAGHPDTPLGHIEIHVVGWLESCAPESCSERELEELDELIEPWLNDHQRKSGAAKK
jgi:hypothetical protein